jgi:N-methylhydantoinase A
MTRIATDVGGTFSDIVWVDEESGEVLTGKAPTTPHDVVQGILAALGKTNVPTDRIRQFVHGSTVATNALIVRSGGRTGLITTRGFRDSIEIRRINRPDDHIYNMFWRKPPELIPRELRLEVTERLRFTGEVLTPLDSDDVRAAIESLKRAGADTVAVCLIHAYANPVHELAIRDMISREWPEVFVSLSHEVAREIREYERVSSTAIDAYVKRPVVSYLRRLRKSFHDDLGIAHDPLIANSTGGVSTVDAIERAPIQMLASGPAGGAIGAAYLAGMTDTPNMVTADVGGTSFDVSLVVDGKNILRTEHEVLGYAVKVSSIDVRSVGAGCGSIASVDDGGMLNVGPNSAGADPGPMCYGQGGTQATVTDAAIVTGIIDSERFAAGEMQLRPDFAENGIEAVASRLGLSPDEAAEGILTIARNNMADITRQIVVGQGYDPRDFTLLGFGGGGGLFACDVARNIGVPAVMIPNHPAAFSAWGMLSADIVGSFARSSVHRFEDLDPSHVAELFTEMEAEARDLLDEASVSLSDSRFERTVAARYEGQGHEVDVPVDGLALDDSLPEMLSQRFDEFHTLRFGHAMEASRETVTFRLRAFGLMTKLSLKEIEAGSSDASVARRRSAFLAGQRHDVPIYERALLRAGNVVPGPAIVEEPTHVTVIAPGDAMTVDRFGNLVISIGG